MPVIRCEFIIDFLFIKSYNYDSLFFTANLPRLTADIPSASAAPVCGMRKKHFNGKEFFDMKKFIRAAALIMAAASLAALVSCGKTNSDNDKNKDKTWVIVTDTVFKPFEMRRLISSVSTLTSLPLSQRIRALSTSFRASVGMHLFRHASPVRQMP